MVGIIGASQLPGDQPMQTRNRIFDDIAKVANSAAGTLAGLKGEVEGLVRGRIESLISELDLVTREEFEIQRKVLERTREKLDRMEQELGELQQNPSLQKPGN